MGLPSVSRGSSADSHTPRTRGLPIASFPLMRRLIVGSVSDRRAVDETAKCPESLCPISALPLSGRRVPPPRRTLLLRLRSYGLMRQSRVTLPSFGFCLVRGVFAGCYQPLLPPGSSRRYLCQSFPRCLDPYHDGLRVALTCYFTRNIGLPQKSMGQRTVLFRSSDFTAEGIFEVAVISLCSGLLVCSPPRSLPPPQ
jgi:hypothetical protein